MPPPRSPAVRSAHRIISAVVAAPLNPLRPRAAVSQAAADAHKAKQHRRSSFGRGSSTSPPLPKTTAAGPVAPHMLRTSSSAPSCANTSAAAAAHVSRDRDATAPISRPPGRRRSCDDARFDSSSSFPMARPPTRRGSLDSQSSHRKALSNTSGSFGSLGDVHGRDRSTDARSSGTPSTRHMLSTHTWHVKLRACLQHRTRASPKPLVGLWRVRRCWDGFKHVPESCLQVLCALTSRADRHRDPIVATGAALATRLVP